jgi:hypothetical protein
MVPVPKRGVLLLHEVRYNSLPIVSAAIICVVLSVLGQFLGNVGTTTGEISQEF